MDYSVTSKLPRVGTTIFTVMSQMAAQHDAINLSQGFPDFDGPQALRDALCHYVQKGFNQYSPLAGVPELRQQIAHKVDSLYQYQACPDQNITVVPGATEAIFCAIQAVVHPGEEVIIFDPAYDSYESSIELSGGKAIHIPLLAPEFKIDWQRVKDSINAKTRMIMINSPHNPTGAILDQEDMRQLAELVRNTGIFILSDEVYEHLVFDGRRHESVLRHPELMERAFVVFSFGKTYHVTGWKTGYCIASEPLMKEFRKVHQFVSFVGVTPIQYALADFMQQCPEHYRLLPDFYQAKRDLFCQHLADSNFSFTPTAGTYFQLVDYSNIRDQADMAFVEYLTKEVGVAAIPISVFYQHAPDLRLARFCFCKEDATLEQAAKILCRI